MQDRSGVSCTAVPVLSLQRPTVSMLRPVGWTHTQPPPPPRAVCSTPRAAQAAGEGPGESESEAADGTLERRLSAALDALFAGLRYASVARERLKTFRKVGAGPPAPFALSYQLSVNLLLRGQPLPRPGLPSPCLLWGESGWGII